MWRKLFKIFGARVCVTEDTDGEQRYRFMYTNKFGTTTCAGMVYGRIILLPDGTVGKGSSANYVKRWMEV